MPIYLSQIKKFPAPGLATKLQVKNIYQDGFLVSWCDPTEEPQCAFSWDRDIKEDTELSQNVGELKTQV